MRFETGAPHADWLCTRFHRRPELGPAVRCAEGGRLWANAYGPVSGASKSKDGLEEALKYAREGDTLVVWKLDRLGRTVKGLVELVEGLQARGVQFKSVTDGFDTSTTAGLFFFHVMAALIPGAFSLS
jgi:hypothetical protein